MENNRILQVVILRKEEQKVGEGQVLRTEKTGGYRAETSGKIAKIQRKGVT